MQKFIILILWILLLTLGESSANTEEVAVASDIPTVDYCDLIRQAKDYDQKQIRIKAVYRVGYEWSEIYCPDCFNQKERTWVEFDDDLESCTNSKVVKLLGDDGKTLSVTVVGVFHSSSIRYGHTGSYRFKFLVKCVENAKLLLKDGRSPNLVPSNLLKGVC
jgi:hypothetical protein